jgi:hypothetical protein
MISHPAIWNMSLSLDILELKVPIGCGLATSRLCLLGANLPCSATADRLGPGDGLLEQASLQLAQALPNPGCPFGDSSYLVLDQLSEDLLDFWGFSPRSACSGKRTPSKGRPWRSCSNSCWPSADRLFVQTGDLAHLVDAPVTHPQGLQGGIPPPLLFVQTAHQQVDLIMEPLRP